VAEGLAFFRPDLSVNAPIQFSIVTIRRTLFDETRPAARRAMNLLAQ
jgi:hypothetical protein